MVKGKCLVKTSVRVSLWMRSFGMIQIRVNDPRSFESWFIKRAEESDPCQE